MVFGLISKIAICGGSGGGVGGGVGVVGGVVGVAGGVDVAAVTVTVTDCVELPALLLAVNV